MALQRDTVAIPFVSGIQPATRARLLDPQKLQTAQNCFFLQDQGPQKRFGHVNHPIRSGIEYVGLGGIVAPTSPPSRETFSAANPGLAASWLYGWGIYSPAQFDTAQPFTVSPQPDVGNLFGATTRDNEVLSWDGHRMFSFAPQQASKFGEMQQTGTAGALSTATRGPVCMPALRNQTLAKIADAQKSPDAADNGVLRVVAWLNSDGVTAGFSAYDSVNRACLVSNSGFTFQTPVYLRCISVGSWFHILVADTTANSLEIRSFTQDNPTTIVSRSLGQVDKQFDVKKIDETSFVVVRTKGGVTNMHVLNADGSTLYTSTPSNGGFSASTNLAIACEVDANKNIGIVWMTAGAPNVVNFGLYSLQGGVIASRIQITTTTDTRRLTVSPRTVLISGGNTVWDVFVEDTSSSIPQIRVYGCVPGISVTLTATRHRMVISSHAFRVGNRNFLWCGPWITGGAALQRTWFLCDSAILPVGKMDYGTANVDFGTSINTLPGVNWHVSSSSHLYKDRIVFHGALPYNQRVAVTPLSLTVGPTGVPAAPSNVFSESSIHFYELDFLPKMRTAQAGRCTYFSGAQLWACDGAEVVEATFHMAPEGVTLAAAGSGGSLSAGTYRYRIDLCHKNLQNEEVRSWSLITAGQVAVNNDKITLTIPVMPMTRREDSYFLIFRTAANGTTYYLVNSRDPSSANFLRNNQASATFTYQDSMSDATAQLSEYHPANSGGTYVDPLPAPACELVAAGRDRLWLSGGELAPGELSPSRLFYPGQAPTFSPALNIQVDRNAEPITAIGFVGDLTAIFRRTNIYVLDSDGPDNSFNGSWAQPRQTVADTGAISQDSLVLSVVGLWFLSPAGLRRLNNGGAMDVAAGHDMDPFVKDSDFASAFVVPQFTQLRWYSRDPNKASVVYNYQIDAWCTWTGVNCVDAVFWPNTGLAVLAKGTGHLWVETEDTYVDSGSTYEMIIKTANLHGGALGDFQRVRQFALFGNLITTQPIGAETLNLRVRLFYNERPFYDEQIVRQIPDTPVFDGHIFPSAVFNRSTWGSLLWGNTGIWGDQSGLSFQLSNTSPLYLRDNVFRLRFRPNRQKCSVIAIEFSDQGSINTRFEPVVLALELARKKGLDRIAT